MEDFYAELKQRAARMRLEEFIAWLQGPVLLLDVMDQADRSWVPGSATAIESTVLFHDSVPVGLEGDTSEDADRVRTARRLVKQHGPPHEPIVIGRSEECDVPIDHDSVSKVHAYISRGEDGSFQILDAGSRNGVTVNGKRVSTSTPMRVRADDVIRIGKIMARIAYPKPLYALLLNKPAPPAPMWRRLRDRTYAAFWASSAFGFLADSMYRIVIVSWVMTKTGSGAALSAIAVFSIVALMVTLLVGGALVDGLSRGRVLLLSQSLRATVVVTVASIELHGSLELWHIYAGAVFLGIGEALLLPAAAALLPEIVRREDLPSANALNTFTFHSSNIMGPPLASIFGALGGPSLSFSIIGVCFLLGSLAASRLPSTKSRHAGTRSPPSSLREAGKFMLGDPWLWMTSLTFALVGAIAFASSAVALPVLIKSSLKIDIDYYSVCQSLVSVGALVASAWMGRRAGLHRRGLVAYAMVFGIGACILSAGLPITIYGIAGAWLLRGAAVAVLGLIWVGTLQQLVPREMLARMASIDAFMSVSFMIVSFVSVGSLTEVVQAEAVLAGAGAILILASVLALSRKRIRAFA